MNTNPLLLLGLTVTVGALSGCTHLEADDSTIVDQIRVQPSNQVLPQVASAVQVGQQYEVSALVPGLVAQNGVCTYEFTGPDDVKLVRAVTAEPDATSTTCGSASVKLTDLQSGVWSITVTYTDQYRSVVSEPALVDVP